MATGSLRNLEDEAYYNWLASMRDMPTDHLDHFIAPVLVKSFRPLVELALNELAAQHKPCDPDECGPCGGLRDMLKDGVLDLVLTKTGSGSMWWDEEYGVVDRAWLAERWGSA